MDGWRRPRRTRSRERNDRSRRGRQVARRLAESRCRNGSGPHGPAETLGVAQRKPLPNLHTGKYVDQKRRSLHCGTPRSLPDADRHAVAPRWRRSLPRVAAVGGGTGVSRQPMAPHEEEAIDHARAQESLLSLLAPGWAGDDAVHQRRDPPSFCRLGVSGRDRRETSASGKAGCRRATASHTTRLVEGGSGHRRERRRTGRRPQRCDRLSGRSRAAARLADGGAETLDRVRNPAVYFARWGDAPARSDTAPGATNGMYDAGLRAV